MIALRFLRSLSISALALILFARQAPADVLAPPYDLYEAGPFADETLAAVRDDLGPWQVILQERSEGGTWVLLALADGRISSPLPGWGRPRYLGRVRDGERVVRGAPEAPGRERLRSGRGLGVTPTGNSILVTNEAVDRIAQRAHQGFDVLERSVPLRRDTAPGPIDAFRPTLERAMRSPAGSRAPADVAALRDQVSPDSLEAYVRALSERASMQPTSRYFADPRTEGVHRDYIQTKFAAALGASAVTNHAFRMERAPRDTITVHNIVAKIPSSAPHPPAVFLTAHYDAIGTRSDPVALCEFGHRKPNTDCDCSLPDQVILANPDCEWNWEIDPAPGADDNATGVAALLEFARICANVAFDFDVYLVAFQGEEQGLIGSAAFVDSVVTSGQLIVVDFNLDMLGYNALGDRQEVVTNTDSEWFADWILDTANLFVPNLPVAKTVENFGRSDHARFWNVGADAVVMLEDIELPYPGYHTFLDLWETIFPGNRPSEEKQFERAVQLVVATMARFALHYDAPDLAIPVGELEAAPVFSSRFEAGRPVRLSAFVHNLGNSSLTFQGTTTDSLTARVSFYDGNPDAGGVLINQIERTDFFGGGTVLPIEIAWVPAVGTEGFHEIVAIVEGLDEGYSSVEVTSANNRASLSLFLEAQGSTAPTFLTHYVYPNPVTGSVSNLRIYYELTRTAALDLRVYDLAGQLLGQFGATGAFVGTGNAAGANVVTGDDIRWVAQAPESGVYLYRIHVRATATGENTDTVTGKFALVR
jgi:hypothetical protein